MMHRDDKVGPSLPPLPDNADGIPTLRPDFETRPECEGKYSAVLGYQTDRYDLVIPGLDELTEIMEQERDTIQH